MRVATEPRVGTMYVPPVLPDDLVRRRRLDDRLGVATVAPLTVVVGPARSGKSVTVRAWLDSVDDAWVWATAERGDDGAGLVLGALVRLDARCIVHAAARRAGAPIDDEFLAFLTEDAHDWFVDDVVVVIDGADLLDPVAGTLIAVLPATVHVVLIGRTVPAWAGVAPAIAGHHLRATPDEAAALDVAPLGTTGGWLAARDFDVEGAGFADFVTRDVLGGWPPALVHTVESLAYESELDADDPMVGELTRLGVTEPTLDGVRMLPMLGTYLRSRVARLDADRAARLARESH